MNNIDGLSGILVGLYLLTVTVRGNGRKFIDLLARDKAFIKWALALAVLTWMYNYPALHGPASYLIALAIIGLVITHISELQKNFSDLWSKLNA